MKTFRIKSGKHIYVVKAKDSDAALRKVEQYVSDERLSPMTYSKLKEMGYGPSDWKNLSQEKANEIVARGAKTGKTNKKTSSSNKSSTVQKLSNSLAWLKEALAKEKGETPEKSQKATNKSTEDKQNITMGAVMPGTKKLAEQAKQLALSLDVSCPINISSEKTGDGQKASMTVFTKEITNPDDKKILENNGFSLSTNGAYYVKSIKETRPDAQFHENLRPDS